MTKDVQRKFLLLNVEQENGRNAREDGGGQCAGGVRAVPRAHWVFMLISSSSSRRRRRRARAHGAILASFGTWWSNSDSYTSMERGGRERGVLGVSFKEKLP